MRRVIAHRENRAAGFTLLEVIVAISIFSLISMAIFNLLTQTDRIHGRAVFVEGASRLAAGEAERLRSAAARSVLIEDSSYSETVSGRLYRVSRNVIEPDAPPSFEPTAREPVMVELTVSDERNGKIVPLRFKLLIGQDNP